MTPLPRLASSVGLTWLGVKRDDRLEALFGGTKPRKLDTLLAAPPFVDARVWAAVGAIGSGNLVALSAAAEDRGRRLEAHMFWTPLSAGSLDNLAFVASGPVSITFHRSSSAAALRHPALVLGGSVRGVPVVPPGASAPLGLLGLVRAGLELAEQIRAGELPEPDRIYVGFGTGGTAVGLAVGLALAGLRTRVVGVRVVARALAGSWRVRSLRAAALRELARFGVEAPQLPLNLEIDHSHAGLGYAIPSRESLDACAELAQDGLHLEPVYTGKAMAALLDDARRGEVGRALFWLTARRDPIPHASDWRERLPPALARRILLAQSTGRTPVTRRRLLLGAAATVAIGALGIRVTGYEPFRGLLVLSAWEAHVLAAAAEALLPSGLRPEALADIAARVDRYLVGMPSSVLLDVHGLLGVIEHGTTPLGGKLHRFTLLAAPDREAYLAWLAARGGLLAQAYGALRELCMLGHYQRSAAWESIGYEGPTVPLSYDPNGPGRQSWPSYDSLRASPGTLPASVVR